MRLDGTWEASCMVFHFMLVLHSLLRLLEPESVWREFPRQQMAFDFATTCWQVHYVITSSGLHLLAALLHCSALLRWWSSLLHSLPCIPYTLLAFLPLTFLLFMTSDRKLGGGLETRLLVSHSHAPRALHKWLFRVWQCLLLSQKTWDKKDREDTLSQPTTSLDAAT